MNALFTKAFYFFGLLLTLSSMVHLSPIFNAAPNRLENLFFMDEQEEMALQKNALNNTVLEKVKARLLKSLHLKEPPKTHQSAPPLQMFQNNSWFGLSVNTERTGESEFFSSQIVPNTCFDRAHCLRFQIPFKNVEKAESAELWLFKKEGVTQLQMTLLKEGEAKGNFPILNQSESAGWIRLDIKPILSASDVLDLEVSSYLLVPLETGQDKNPLLIVTRDELQRSKRATICEEGTCCMKSIYVSFKTIGYDSWIIKPEGYNANICKGSCDNLDSADTYHATILLLLLKSKRNTSEVSVHCTPTEYKPLSIIYADESDVKIMRNLQDMAVSQCGCR